MSAAFSVVFPTIKRLTKKLNKDEHFGRVLFIVEGSKMEFSLLKQIFCNLLGYRYIEKRETNRHSSPVTMTAFLR